MKDEENELYPWALLLEIFKGDEARKIEGDPFYKNERIIKKILAENPNIPGARLPNDLPVPEQYDLPELDRFLCNILQPLAFLRLEANQELIPNSVDETIPWNEMDAEVKEQYYQWRDQFSFDICADGSGLKDVLRNHDLPLPQGFYPDEPDNTQALTGKFNNPDIVTLQIYRNKLASIRNAHCPKNDTAPLTPSADAAVHISWPELAKKYREEIDKIQNNKECWRHCSVYYKTAFEKLSREEIVEKMYSDWNKPPALRTVTRHTQAGKEYLCYAPNGPHLPPLDE